MMVPRQIEQKFRALFIGMADVGDPASTLRVGESRRRWKVHLRIEAKHDLDPRKTLRAVARHIGIADEAMQVCEMISLQELPPASIIAWTEWRVQHVENNPRSRLVDGAHSFCGEDDGLIKPHDVWAKLGHRPAQVAIGAGYQRPKWVMELHPLGDTSGWRVGANIENVRLLLEPSQRV